jgi:hypothetical protein
LYFAAPPRKVQKEEASQASTEGTATAAKSIEPNQAINEEKVDQLRGSFL